MSDTENAEAKEKPAETKKPDPAPEKEVRAEHAEVGGKKLPLPHEVADALDHDVILMLDAVVTAATHENLRKCPALANICQSYEINKPTMVDWLKRTRIRQEQREERRKADKA